MWLLASGVVVAGGSGVVLWLLRAPLLAILLEVCVLDHRARFWWRVSAAELVVGTAFCASTSLAVSSSTDRWLSAVAVLRGGYAGLLVSIAAITVGTMAVGRGAQVMAQSADGRRSPGS
jgi:hypothetical protein